MSVNTLSVLEASNCVDVCQETETVSNSCQVVDNKHIDCVIAVCDDTEQVGELDNNNVLSIVTGAAGGTTVQDVECEVDYVTEGLHYVTGQTQQQQQSTGGGLWFNSYYASSDVPQYWNYSPAGATTGGEVLDGTGGAWFSTGVTNDYDVWTTAPVDNSSELMFPLYSFQPQLVTTTTTPVDYNYNYNYNYNSVYYKQEPQQQQQLELQQLGPLSPVEEEHSLSDISSCNSSSEHQHQQQQQQQQQHEEEDEMPTMYVFSNAVQQQQQQPIQLPQPPTGVSYELLDVATPHYYCQQQQQQFADLDSTTDLQPSPWQPPYHLNYYNIKPSPVTSCSDVSTGNMSTSVMTSYNDDTTGSNYCDVMPFAPMASSCSGSKLPLDVISTHCTSLTPTSRGPTTTTQQHVMTSSSEIDDATARMSVTSFMTSRDRAVSVTSYRLSSALMRASGAVSIRLCNLELWKEFSVFTNEMIITKVGRRIFPTFELSIGGLKSDRFYSICIDMLQIGETQWKYQASRWTQTGQAAPPPARRVCVHHESPQTGQYWMSKDIIFNRLKLTNSTVNTDQNTIVLNSMHLYQPRVHVIELSDSVAEHRQVFTHAFTETQFIAVTAYQNTDITQLKIDNNPFAKGFRDNQETSSLLAVAAPASNRLTPRGHQSAVYSVWRVNDVTPVYCDGRCSQQSCETLLHDVISGQQQQQQQQVRSQTAAGVRRKAKDDDFQPTINHFKTRKIIDDKMSSKMADKTAYRQ